MCPSAAVTLCDTRFWRVCMHAKYVCECILYFHCARLVCQCPGSTAGIGERRWLVCFGDRAHTLGCVLSLQWRGCCNKVQKETTAEENRHCFHCVYFCMLVGSLFRAPSPPSFPVGAAALNTNAYSSLIKHRLICVLRTECLYRCSHLNCRRYIVLNYT